MVDEMNQMDIPARNNHSKGRVDYTNVAKGGFLKTYSKSFWVNWVKELASHYCFLMQFKEFKSL